MTSASRRIFFYWLLLIIPTIAVGAAAFWLLYREQIHIGEQAAAASAARRAAVEARTRLIAENIGLIMTDVQSGLMTTLLDAPASAPSSYLANWRRTNPLVHDVYVASATGAIRWGAQNTPATAWLATAPWRVSVAQPGMMHVATPAASATQAFVADETVEIDQAHDAQKESKAAAPAPVAEKKDADISAIADNVAQYQSARSTIQAMASYNVNVAPSQTQRQQTSKLEIAQDKKFPASSSYAPDKRKRASKTKIEEAGMDSGASAAKNQKQEPSEKALAFADTTPPSAGMRVAESAIVSEAHDVVETPVPQAALPQIAFGDTLVAPDITGWTPWKDDAGVLHLFGWRLTPRGTVLAVEVNLEAIASRLREVLPTNVEPDEAYVLLKGKNAPIAQIGEPGSYARAYKSMGARQPYEQALGLPGWQVIGYTLASGAPGFNTSAFLLLSALLIGLFVLAIIGGGSLLMRQARLSAAESAQKTSFVANVSHEFKTPLTTIRLYSELLEQGRIRDEAKRAESLQTISRETQRLARLVNNVLDFSRLEQGRKKFDLAEYDLSGEIARMLDRHAPRIAEAGLRIERQIPDAPCPVKTDLDAVEQILINLLDNACKYASAGGEVTVSLSGTGSGGTGSGGTGFQPVGSKSGTGFQPVSDRSEHGQDAHATQSHGLEARATKITVADRGPGIPPAHREKIFEKFHRVDDTLTASQGGAGLGLSIARQLARGLGGDLTYRAREGGGGEFTLTLPAHA